MDSGISATSLRIIIAVIGALILIAIYFFGRPGQRGQGRRILFKRGRDSRVEPVIGDTDEVIADPADPGTEVPEPRQGELDVGLREELDRLGEAVASARRPPGRAAPQRPLPGKRSAELPVERIVTLFVVARGGEGRFSGSDIAVAAEKVGLEFGDMQIFHRPLDGKPEAGPIFSMANMVKPGTFDMSRIDELRTPGLTFFMTLPGPLSALDAWDAILPATQRMAELLGGNVLDEERNALGRQRIAVLRDELRAWDRKHEGPEIQFNPRR